MKKEPKFPWFRAGFVCMMVAGLIGMTIWAVATHIRGQAIALARLGAIIAGLAFALWLTGRRLERSYRAVRAIHPDWRVRSAVSTEDLLGALAKLGGDISSFPNRDYSVVVALGRDRIELWRGATPTHLITIPRSLMTNIRVQRAIVSFLVPYPAVVFEVNDVTFELAPVRREGHVWIEGRRGAEKWAAEIEALTADPRVTTVSYEEPITPGDGLR